MRILVTGATGYVGSRLVTVLLSAGHEIVAASRNPARLKQFGWYRDVSPIALDASEEASTRAAFTQAGPVDVVYYLVHGIGQPDFRDADNSAAANVAAAANDAHVRRIVYLGGFLPDDESLSQHLAGRAEVAEALRIDGGAEVVWLGAAMIIGSGSTSFEILRYVGDRFWVIPLPHWVDNPMDPISIRDVLYYLEAAADAGLVPAGAYDISGPESTTHRELIAAYVDAAGTRRGGVPVRLVPRDLLSRMTGVALPVPAGLAADLTASLDHPMLASDQHLREHVPDPPGGLTGIDDAIAAALSCRRAKPVTELADPHHLADTDPVWAGGDAFRIRRVMRAVTPTVARPALGLVHAVPGPLAAAVRTGLDMLIDRIPRRRSA